MQKRDKHIHILALQLDGPGHPNDKVHRQRLLSLSLFNLDPEARPLNLFLPRECILLISKHLLESVSHCG